MVPKWDQKLVQKRVQMRGSSWGRLGAVLGRLGASWGVLERLGGVWAPSWPSKTSQHKPDSTWNGKRRSFKGSFMQKPQRTILDRKASSSSRTLRSLRSLAALALRVFIGVSLGFCWGVAGDLGSQTSPTLCKSSAKSLAIRAQYPRISAPKPSRFDPKT